MKTLHNTTPVPNQVFSRIPELSGVELKCLLLIIRNTLGWIDQHTGERKVRDWIANSVFASKTGISDRSVSKAIESLIEKKIIKVTGYGGAELNDPQQRKFTNRIFYQLNLDNSEKTASNQRKNFARPKQKVLSTKEILQKKFSKSKGRRLTDRERLEEIGWQRK